jgi:hypothetical protein
VAANGKSGAIPVTGTAKSPHCFHIRNDHSSTAIFRGPGLATVARCAES